MKQLARCRERVIDANQRATVRVENHVRTRGGFRDQHIVRRIQDPSTRATRLRPFGEPHQSQITVETVEIRKSGQQAMGEFTNINAQRPAAKFNHRCRQWRVRTGWSAFARQLTKRAVDHGESWKGGLHGWNQQVNALQVIERQDFLDHVNDLQNAPLVPRPIAKLGGRSLQDEIRHVGRLAGPGRLLIDAEYE